MAAAGGGGGAPAACAACKYQRRRCAVDCPLAQYFPHDRPRVFRNAHRLFGVSNILKTLNRAGPDPDRRHEAMQCIVYESRAWDLYPSAGCVPIILGLQRRIQQAEHELRRVHADLQAYRRAAAAFAQGGGRPPPVHHHRPDNNLDGAGARYSAEATASSSSPPAPPPPPPFFQLQWTAMGDDDDEGIAAARAPFMYGHGGGDERRQQMMAMVINNAAVTSDDDGNIIAAVTPPLQMLPWTVQPPQYEHPFFVDATTMVPQFQPQQQPIVDVSTQLPELQDDMMMNYFAGVGINGENNDKMPRESSTDSSDEKATKEAPPKMKDNSGFIIKQKQDVDSSSTLPAAAAANKS